MGWEAIKKWPNFGKSLKMAKITITTLNINHQFTKLVWPNHQIITLFWGKSPSPPLLRITKSPPIFGLNHQITTHFWSQSPLTTKTCPPPSLQTFSFFQTQVCLSEVSQHCLLEVLYLTTSQNETSEQWSLSVALANPAKQTKAKANTTLKDAMVRKDWINRRCWR